MRSPKRWLQILLSLGISFAFIWYAIRGIDFARVGEELKRADYFWLVPTLLLLASIQYLRSWRFKYLAEPIARMDFASLVRINNIGMMAVFLLPIRLGEFVRPYLMKREFRSSMSAGLGAVAAERVIDGLVVTLGFFAVTRGGVEVPQEMSNAGLAAFLVFAGAATALGILLIGHERGAAFIHKPIAIVSTKLADRIVGMLRSFAQGLEALRSLRALVVYVSWTLLYWLVQGASYYTLYEAMHISLPLLSAYILVALTVIALMLPAGPGFIGPMQAAMVWGLGLFGVEREKAFAFSILTHAAGAVIQIGFGLVSLLGAHLSMSSLVKESQASASEGA